MKISWGYRVMFLYVGFAGLIIYFVTRSMNEKVDLVTPDYYAQELKFQDKIESINRNNDLNQALGIEYSDAGIIITYPTDLQNKTITGAINIFRPSDKSKDQTIEITPDKEMKQTINTASLSKGMYRIKVDYEVDGSGYYSEKQIVIR
ncbi:MAG: FixH [Bacteroidetes bacterium ADurb.Bin397]|nr:FixH family protein [Bacteroidia bacterium]OQA12164.1 MAG: FixH [Bacteroidetes bacterium ADurb.Bin397]